MKNKGRFMFGAFLGVLCLGFLGGKMFGESLWAAAGGLVGAFISMFVGMILGQMNSRAEFQAIEKQSREIQADFERFSAKIRGEKRELIRVLEDTQSVNEGTVRAVSSRVANRILSKFVTGLGNDARREMVFQEVEDIVTEEMGRAEPMDLVAASEG